MTDRLKICIEILEYALKQNVSGAEACKKYKKSRNYISNTFYESDGMLKKGFITATEHKSFHELYNRFLEKKTPKTKAKPEAKSNKIEISDEDLAPLTEEELADVEYDAEKDDAYDERSVGLSIRGENGKISEYTFEILIRDQPPLKGRFSREEMDKVYRLYSNLDGAGLTLRAVSREFHNLTFRDFKRILRAFNITKQSVPVAPHILEERSEEEILNLIIRNKENNVLRKLEQERGKYIEKHLVEAHKKIINYQTDESWVEKIVEKYFEQNANKKKNLILPKVQQTKTNNLKKPSFCLFGDIHYGKKFDRAIFGRGYNKEIAHERILQIAKAVIDDYKMRNPSEIVLMCVGDLVECVMEDGMHPGHTYEMDLFQEEQIFFAVDSLREMLLQILKETKCNIQFHSIQGNHDRIGISRDSDKNRTAGKIISTILSREISLQTDRVIFNIPKNNLIRIVSGKLSFFVQHGDSSLSKKKPSELVTLYGEPGCYTVLLQGHWHSLKTEEGTNFISLKLPSVASTDKFILEELGNNNLPGFIIGHEPEDCYGFNYTKLTLK